MRKCGPTNQLLNIIKYLDKKAFNVKVLTLSPEPSDTYINVYKNLGIDCNSLNLGRIKSIFLAIPRLIRFVKRFKPDIIHSQGIRPDFLSSFLDKYCKARFITLRNFAYEDYGNKYGIMGNFIAKLHLSVAKKCKYLVACSEKLSKRLNKIGIETTGISNGINVELYKPNFEIYKSNNNQKPVFIVSGALSKRKNNSFLVRFFDNYFDTNKGTLIFIGEGEELNSLKSLTNKTNIIFLGKVVNPEYYLQQADIIVSASKSEGLPNSILEGLGCGLPSVLSNIPSHLEIKEILKNEVFLFNLDNENDLAEKIKLALDFAEKTSKKDISEKLINNFSAEIMSKKYQNLYFESMKK